MVNKLAFGIPILFSLCAWLCPLISSAGAVEGNNDSINIATSSRLLKFGESIDFTFHLSGDKSTGTVEIFQQYLENAKPGARFVAGGDMAWLDTLQGKKYDLKFADGKASLSFQPQKPGNYILRWSVQNQNIYRYFSVIEDDWIVIRYAMFATDDPKPTLHATGIPLDYHYPVEKFEPADATFSKYMQYNRCYGDSIIPLHKTNASGTANDPNYADGIKKQTTRIKKLFADKNSPRSIRFDENNPPLGASYVDLAEKLGVNDFCGLIEGNAQPWLGMPMFPYFASEWDCRVTRQSPGGSLVAHQWDFCGGFHFVGPPAWHYSVSMNDWHLAEKCLGTALEEYKNAAELSGHPIFVYPLYDSVDSWRPSPNLGVQTEGIKEFFQKYQEYIALEIPKKHKVAFARSIDISDYIRRHWKVTPKTIMVSRTNHVEYDLYWTLTWGIMKLPMTREKLPWLTKPSMLRANTNFPDWQDPYAYEFIYLECQQSQLRFEYAAPNPVWWFDYTKPPAVDKKGMLRIQPVVVPDAQFVRNGWVETADGLRMKLVAVTDAEMRDYPICLWDLPGINITRDDIKTNAKKFELVKNTNGKYHVILFFDLKNQAEIEIVLGTKTTPVKK